MSGRHSHNRPPVAAPKFLLHLSKTTLADLAWDLARTCCDGGIDDAVSTADELANRAEAVAQVEAKKIRAWALSLHANPLSESD
jgi:hypothetical protein